MKHTVCFPLFCQNCVRYSAVQGHSGPRLTTLPSTHDMFGDYPWRQLSDASFYLTCYDVGKLTAEFFTWQNYVMQMMVEKFGFAWQQYLNRHQTAVGHRRSGWTRLEFHQLPKNPLTNSVPFHRKLACQMCFSSRQTCQTCRTHGCGHRSQLYVEISVPRINTWLDRLLSLFKRDQFAPPSRRQTTIWTRIEKVAPKCCELHANRGHSADQLKANLTRFYVA